MIAAAALAFGTATAALVINVGAGAQTPPSPSCKSVKGSFTQWPGSTPNTSVGVFKGSIDGSYTASFIGAPDPVRARADVVINQKKGSPPINLYMENTGTNWTTPRAVAGGWMQTPLSNPQATSVYYLSIMLEPFASEAAGNTWSYTGQLCQY